METNSVPTSTRPRKVLRRRCAPELGKLESAALLDIESAANFHSLRSDVHEHFQPAGGYARFLADGLVDQAWEFVRTASSRTCGLHLQLFDDHEQVDREFEDLDPGTRIFLAMRNLASQKSFESILRHEERVHRRRRQFDQDLLTHRRQPR